MEELERSWRIGLQQRELIVVFLRRRAPDGKLIDEEVWADCMNRMKEAKFLY
jgi:hypothetical protein